MIKLLNEVQLKKSEQGGDFSADNHSSINRPHLKTMGLNKSTLTVISGCKRPSLLTVLQTQLFFNKVTTIPWHSLGEGSAHSIQTKPLRLQGKGWLLPLPPLEILKSSSRSSQTIEVSSSTCKSRSHVMDTKKLRFETNKHSQLLLSSNGDFTQALLND